MKLHKHTPFLSLLIALCTSCGDDSSAPATDAESSSDASDTPSCSDQISNQDESDVDCGGDQCEPCTAGQHCSDGEDCQSALCEDSTCVATFSVGGSLSGLNFPGLVLQNNGGDDLEIDQDGNFTFAGKLRDDENYAVSILEMPDKVKCEIENASGSIANADISDVAVTCVNRIQVSHGLAHSCALLPSGEVKCWGKNDRGQLGLGDTEHRGDNPDEMGDNLPTVDLGSNVKAIAVTAGYTHSCAILEGGSVKCWGDNSVGKLGLGDIAHRGDEAGEMGDALPTVDLGSNRRASKIAIAQSHTCALLDNNSVKCWGNSNLGQLGLESNLPRGTAENEMGDNLPALDFGEGSAVRQLALGQHHSCVLLDNNSVKCWGAGFVGQLGISGADMVGDEANEMGANLPAVELGDKEVRSIHAHLRHGCAVFVDGSAKCWGGNSLGQLGLGDTNNRGDDDAELGENLPEIAFGSARKAITLALGAEFTCAILDDSSVSCWGGNSSGQLGLGNQDNRGDQANEMGKNLIETDLGPNSEAISLGGGQGYACATSEDDSIQCWGRNDFGQLGAGDVQTRGDEPDEMGKNLSPIDLGISQ